MYFGCLPLDTIIVQVQQWGVVGAQRVVDQVLVNGVSLTGSSEEVDRIIQTLSADARLSTLTSVNQTSALSKKNLNVTLRAVKNDKLFVNSFYITSSGNHTVLRSRECILEGSQLHWTDRVFYDGKVYLSLDHTDTWTAQVPQAMALKVLWDQEPQLTRTERIRLQEGCIKLMKELRLSGESSGKYSFWLLRNALRDAEPNEFVLPFFVQLKGQV